MREFGESWEGRKVVGIGYPFPYLPSRSNSAPFLSAAFVPEWLGALRWPPTPPHRAATVDTLGLPLPAESLDIIFCAHFMEFLESPHEHLQEIWRVLKPEGLLITLTPNRYRPWARSEITPFAFGTPYSQRQLTRQLHKSRFRVEAEAGCMLSGPRGTPLGIALLKGLEPLGRYLPGLYGLKLTMARKHIYASIPKGSAPAAVTRFIPAAAPVA